MHRARHINIKRQPVDCSFGDFREEQMRFGPFLVIAILLLFVWVLCFLLFHVASLLIHLLLLFAVVSFIAHLLMGARPA